MDATFAASILKIVVFLPVVLILAYISIKVGASKLSINGKGRVIKVIEKVPLSGKIFLCVVLINEKPYVLSCSDSKVELIAELDSDSLKELKTDESGFKESLLNNFKLILKRKD